MGVFAICLDLCGMMCKHSHMATNIELDNTLVKKVMKFSGLNTKREAVNEALSEYVQKREQLKIINLFGTIDYHGDYDYKAERKRE